MGYLSGSQGAIQFGSQAGVDLENNTGWKQSEIRVTNWTMNTTNQLLDTTTLGDYDRHTDYGLRTSSGSLRLLYYNPTNDSSTPANNSASWFINALQRAAYEQDYGSLDQPNSFIQLDSVPVTLRLFLNEMGRGPLADYMEFDCNLSNVSYASTVGELCAVDVQFEVNGRIIRSHI